jgi:hypothetical protein
MYSNVGLPEINYFTLRMTSHIQSELHPPRDGWLIDYLTTLHRL